MKIENGILQDVLESDIKDGRFTIPDSVTCIDFCAFSYCTSLKSITIPDSVTSIEGYAFYNCSALTSITIPDGVTDIGDYAFYKCSALTSITIPDSVTDIGYYAFFGCISLRHITIPNNLTSIGGYAFYGCESLTSITIPDSVTDIGVCAFSYCYGLVKKGKFKATNGIMRCRDFKYEIRKQYHENEAILCKNGFHYCTNAFDLFNYYGGEIGIDVRFFKVKTSGTSRAKFIDSKRVCTDITLMEEIKSYKDLLN